MSAQIAEDRPLLRSSNSEEGRSGISNVILEYSTEGNRNGSNPINNSNLPSDYEEEEDEEYNEMAQSYTVSGHHIDSTLQQTTNCETLTHLIKGNIGTGILAMPDALKNSGLFTGAAILPILAVICIHCMHTLVRCSLEMKERSGLYSLDYADVGEQAFLHGPVILRPFSTIARRIINTFLVVTQLGFCCVYVVFISANIHQVVTCHLPGLRLDIHGYMALLLVPLLIISMVRSLKVLAPFSFVSNLFLMLGLSITFYYVLQDMPPYYDRKEFSSWGQLPLFLGTAIYAFEGIGVVLPLERNMAHPEDFGGCNGVLNTAMVIVSCGYYAVGFFGYLKYGDAVAGSITLNLPPGDNLSQCVKVLMSLAIYLTYSLMLYVPVQIMWPHIKGRFHTRRSRKLGEYAFRAFLVLLTFILAAAIPNIGLFISLVGAISSSMLAIIFPPIIEIVTFWDRISKVALVKCTCIIIIGISCFISGTYASVTAIFIYFSQNDHPVPALVC